MNRRFCPYEEKATRAARTGEWEDSLRAHVLQCALCGEAAFIAERVRQRAAADTAGAVLPDPGQVFLHARMASVQEAQERALRPLAIAELAIRIALLAAAAGGSLWAWFGLRSMAAGLQAAAPVVPLSLPIAAAALIPCGIAILGARLLQPVLLGE